MSSTRYLMLLFAVFISYRGASTEAKPVLDLLHHPLRSDSSYYILNILGEIPRGGGPIMSKSVNQTCPNSVIQNPEYSASGLPIRFSPYYKSSLIYPSIDLNFIFNETAIWRLDYDKTTNQSFISTCGTEGDPGQLTVSNWFKIEEYGGEGYKIRYCPTVCDFCKYECGDIGGIEQDGKSRLAIVDGIRNPTWQIVFLKVT